MRTFQLKKILRAPYGISILALIFCMIFFNNAMDPNAPMIFDSFDASAYNLQKSIYDGFNPTQPDPVYLQNTNQRADEVLGTAFLNHMMGTPNIRAQIKAADQAAMDNLRAMGFEVSWNPSGLGLDISGGTNPLGQKIASAYRATGVPWLFSSALNTYVDKVSQASAYYDPSINRLVVGKNSLEGLSAMRTTDSSNVLAHEYVHAYHNKLQSNNQPTVFSGFILPSMYLSNSSPFGGYANGFNTTEVGAYLISSRADNSYLNEVKINPALDDSATVSFNLKYDVLKTNLMAHASLSVSGRLSSSPDSQLLVTIDYPDGKTPRVYVESTSKFGGFYINNIDPKNVPKSGLFTDLPAADQAEVRQLFKNANKTFIDIINETMTKYKNEPFFSQLASQDKQLTAIDQQLVSQFDVSGATSEITSLVDYFGTFDSGSFAGPSQSGTFVPEDPTSQTGASSNLQFSPASGLVITGSLPQSPGATSPVNDNHVRSTPKAILDFLSGIALNSAQNSAALTFADPANPSMSLEVSIACGNLPTAKPFAQKITTCFNYQCLGRANSSIGDTIVITKKSDQICSTLEAMAEINSNAQAMIAQSAQALNASGSFTSISNDLPANFSAFGNMPLLNQGSGWLQGLFIDKYNFNYAQVGLCSPTAASMVALGLKDLSKYSDLNNVFDSSNPKQILPLKINGQTSYRTYDEYAVHIEYMARLLGLLDGSGSNILYSPDDYESIANNKIFFQNAKYSGMKIGSIIYRKDAVFDTKTGQTYLSQLYSDPNIKKLNLTVRTDIPNLIAQHSGVLLNVYSPSYAGIPDARSTLDSGTTINRHALAVQGISGSHIIIFDPWGRSYHVTWTDVQQKSVPYQTWYRVAQVGYQWVNSSYTPIMGTVHCNQGEPGCLVYNGMTQAWDTWALTHIGIQPGGYIGNAQTPNQTDGLSETYAIVTAMFTADPWPVTNGRGLAQYREDHNLVTSGAATLSNATSTCSEATLGTISFGGANYQFRNPIKRLVGSSYAYDSTTPVTVGCLNFSDNLQAGQSQAKNFIGSFAVTCTNGSINVSNINCSQPATPVTCSIPNGTGAKYPQFISGQFSYGKCQAVTCNPGFTNYMGTCYCGQFPDQLVPGSYNVGVVTSAGQCVPPNPLSSCPVGYVQLKGSPVNPIQCAKVGSTCPYIKFTNNASLWNTSFQYPVYSTRSSSLDFNATSYVVDSAGYCNISSCNSNKLLASDANGINYCVGTPKAFIDGQPMNSSSMTQLQISVIGRKAKSYAYKIGPTKTTKCSVSSGYSSPRPISTPITDDISTQPFGKITLCVQGIGALGERDPKATQVTWNFIAPPAPTCSFGSKSLAVGASVKAFQADFVPYGSACVSENRVCGVNSALSGSYTFATCKVLPLDPATQTPVFQIKGPVRILPGIVPDVLSTSLDLTIGSSNKSTVSYKYQFNSTGTSYCPTSAGYSSVINIATPLHLDIGSLKYGTNSVCVIGINGLGVQSLPVQAYFNKPDIRPVAISFQDGILPVKSDDLGKVVLHFNPSPAFTSFDYKIFPMNLPDSCDNPIGYKPGGNLLSTTVTNFTTKPIGTALQLYKICVLPYHASAKNVATTSGFASLGIGKIGKYAARTKASADLVYAPLDLESFPPQAAIGYVSTSSPSNVPFAYKYKWYCPGCTLKNPYDSVAAAALLKMNSQGDCTSSIGYSNPQQFYTHTEDIIDFSKYNGLNIICQVLQDGKGNWQPYSSASSYKFDSTSTFVSYLTPTLPTTSYYGPGMLSLDVDEGISTYAKSLTVRPDGDLCILDRIGTKIWCLGKTAGQNCLGGSCRLNFQSDGNLCMNAKGKVSCSSTAPIGYGLGFGGNATLLWIKTSTWQDWYYNLSNSWTP